MMTYRVQPQPKDLNTGIIFAHSRPFGDNSLAKVPVDSQSSRSVNAEQSIETHLYTKPAELSLVLSNPPYPKTSVNPL
jgi:hypothetical protein